jgi:dephospho-CoA kinase
MEFEKLISVSGKGSLYKIVSKTNFGLIAESLEDGKRMPVYQSNNVSTLTDISIYTNEGDVL